MRTLRAEDLQRHGFGTGPTRQSEPNRSTQAPFVQLETQPDCLQLWNSSKAALGGRSGGAFLEFTQLVKGPFKAKVSPRGYSEP